jgi:hypothetical protein
MPNWVTNHLVITGEDKSLNALREQMCQPYQTHSYDFMTNAISHGEQEGQFLLWNIVRPTNLQAYYEYEKHLEQAEKRKNITEPALEAGDVINKIQEALSSFNPEAFAESAKKFARDVEVGQDWYNWNIREWGTKWEIDGVGLAQRTGELKYEFATAWSPPIPALSKLASQYPQLVFTIRFHDEGDCFAGEVHWRNGFQEFETDLETTHGFLEEMYGECWACGDGNENDPEYADSREELKCAEFKAIEQLVEEL